MNAELDGNVDQLLKLSHNVELQDQLLLVLTSCISHPALTHGLNRVDLDAVDIQYLMIVYEWQQRGRANMQASIKPFLYRIMLRNDLDLAHLAIDYFGDWCDLTLFDRMVFHSMALLGTSDLQHIALNVLSRTDHDSFLLAIQVVASASRATTRSEAGLLFDTISRLSSTQRWCCLHIDFTPFLSLDTDSTVPFALDLMLSSHALSPRYLSSVLRCTESNECNVAQMANQWLNAFLDMVFCRSFVIIRRSIIFL